MAEKKREFNRKLYVPMILGSILNPINSSIIAVALIPIGTALGVSPAQTAWLISALYLSMVVGQPIVGQYIDFYGPKRMYVISVSLVAVGSVVALFSPNIWWLVASRVLIGFGTCAGYPSAMYLIRSESERTGQQSPAGILAVLAFANQTIVVVGPFLGGVLVQFLGWRSAFLINLPLAVACIIFGLLWYPKTKRIQQEKTNIDFIGMVLFAVMMVALLIFLNNPVIKHMAFLVVFVLAGASFVFYELKIPENPFIPLKLLAGNKPLVLTYIRTLVTAAAAYSFIYGFSQWMQEGRGFSASTAGMISVPMALVALIVVSLTGKSPRIYLKIVIGGIALATASVLQLFLQDDSLVIILLAATALMGIPQGLNNLANQNALYHQAPAHQIASSAGLMKTFLYLGAIIASVANGVFLKEGAFSAGLHKLAVFQMVISAGLLAIVFFDKSIKNIGKNLGSADAYQDH